MRPTFSKLFSRRNNCKAVFPERADKKDALQSRDYQLNNISGNTVSDDTSEILGVTTREEEFIEVLRSPRITASPRKEAVLANAKKYKEGEEALAAGDLEGAKKFFNVALRARLLLFGADSDLVSRCHFKLMEIACLEGDDEKIDYHESAIVRASDARDMEQILKASSILVTSRKV